MPNIIDLTDQDIDYIGRVVQTEVDPYLARNDPQEYRAMVEMVVDTILNRIATGRFGSSVTEVLNDPKAFTKITGPASRDPYGSVQATPKASAKVQSLVNAHLAARAQGKPSTIGERAKSQGLSPELAGSVNYANPFHSDKTNLHGWVNPMIAAGAVKVGQGDSVHYHGNEPGAKGATAYQIQPPIGFFPGLMEPWERRYNPNPVPSPRPPSPTDFYRQLADGLGEAGLLGLDGRRAIEHGVPPFERGTLRPVDRRASHEPETVGSDAVVASAAIPVPTPKPVPQRPASLIFERGSSLIGIPHSSRACRNICFKGVSCRLSVAGETHLRRSSR
jgi:hypothetical protein